MKVEKDRKIEEYLIDAFENHCQPFKNSLAYLEVCKAYKQLLENPSPENKHCFIHAADVFRHLCDTDPEGMRLKKERNEFMQNNKKNEHLKNLYKKHLETLG